MLLFVHTETFHFNGEKKASLLFQLQTVVHQLSLHDSRTKFKQAEFFFYCFFNTKVQLKVAPSQGTQKNTIQVFELIQNLSHQTKKGE